MKFAVILLLLLTSVNLRAGTEKVGMLTLEVPAGFKAEAKHQKESLGDLEVYRWRADDGRVLEVLFYAERPKQDRGPMITSKEEDIEVVGLKTKLIETEMFFGASEKAFVVHLRFGESTYIVDSKGMQRSEFIAVLKAMRHQKTEANKPPQRNASTGSASNFESPARRG